MRQSLGLAIAGGEAEYTRFGFLGLLRKGCAHVAQPDVRCAGGLTEVKRIEALGTRECFYQVKREGDRTPLGRVTMRTETVDDRKGLAERPVPVRRANGPLRTPRRPGTSGRAVSGTRPTTGRAGSEIGEQGGNFCTPAGV